MTIQGLHHITLICSNAQQTVDFYTQTLGLRMIKQTVNFDDPGSYHLYFGDETGSPGSAVTFFEWKHLSKGYPGIGGTHHFALTVRDYDGLLQWKRYLTDRGIKVKGPYNRRYFQSLYFQDPDGVNLEIATAGSGFGDGDSSVHEMPPADMMRGEKDETWSDAVSQIRPAMALNQGMHHISAISSNIERTHEFYSGLLGMARVKMTANFDNTAIPHWYWGVDGGKPGSLITYFEYQPGQMRYAKMGNGLTHHFALSVPDEDSQLEWREKLVRAGLSVSPVMDRIYFKSIYTRDPDGHIVELATAGPGFSVDESVAELGSRLKLPPWLEQHRAQIEAHLTPLKVGKDSSEKGGGESA